MRWKEAPSSLQSVGAAWPLQSLPPGLNLTASAGQVSSLPWSKKAFLCGLFPHLFPAAIVGSLLCVRISSHSSSFLFSLLSLISLPAKTAAVLAQMRLISSLLQGLSDFPEQVFYIQTAIPLRLDEGAWLLGHLAACSWLYQIAAMKSLSTFIKNSIKCFVITTLKIKIAQRTPWELK